MEIKQVVVGIVRRGDEYLVGRRAAHQTLAGYAEFPGGKLLDGEPAELGLMREVLEETGLSIRILPWQRKVVHAYAHGELHITFYLCEAIQDRPPTPPFRWVPRGELGRLRFPDANTAIFSELFPELATRPRAPSLPDSAPPAEEPGAESPTANPRGECGAMPPTARGGGCHA